MFSVSFYWHFFKQIILLRNFFYSSCWNYLLWCKTFKRFHHLCEQKFRHNFQGSLYPFCTCGRHFETTIHFCLHFSNYSNQRKTLVDKISNLKRSLWNQNDSLIVETLLFGSNCLNDEENALIIESTIEYIITTERFIAPLLWIDLSKSPSLEMSNWFWIYALLNVYH